MARTRKSPLRMCVGCRDMKNKKRITQDSAHSGR